MKVLCISGKAQSGKDTSANIIKKILETNNNLSCIIIHYADLLKYVCKEYFGWDGKKDDKGRSLLQHVGTDIVRKSNPNFWVNFVKEFLYIFQDKWDFAIIPDTRFPNEITSLKEIFQTYHIRILRDNFDNNLNSTQKLHPSETALDSCDFDYLIENNSDTADLSNKCFELIDNILNK